MLPFGVILKLLARKPLIFDMHENYPAALKSYKKTSFIERILKNYKAAEVVEKFLIRFVNKIIVVTEENKNRLLERGIPSKKIKLVSNTVDIEQFTPTTSLPSESQNYADNFTLIYSGRVSFNRGLDTAIEALQYLKNSVPNVKLLIVGEGPHLPKLKKLANVLGVEEYVDFLSWPGHAKIKGYISMADICLIPQPSNEHADTTVPHKLFEYMSQAKPILSSDAKPLKRILEETKSGLWFESNNPKDFAKKVEEIKNSHADYGVNGKKAVENKYNWENDKRELLDLYLELSGGRR
ncbi:MAG: glycosyltransferase WbuB [Bacteroidetes bacterium]|nr:MAG: glycosyltransferase WbuB [Bacteroidota bacterium]